MIDPEGSLRSYWQERLRMHLGDRYRGLRLVKLPEDLRSYQHLIEATRPTTIIELGSLEGGSALWFADQLSTLCGGGRVISIDQYEVAFSDDRITFITGDLRTVALPAADGRVMVVDDSAHTYDVTTAALERYSPLVTRGCFFVVEDTIVDTDLSIWPDVHGAGKAVDDFLSRQTRFERRDMDRYGLTMHGWLEAVS